MFGSTTGNVGASTLLGIDPDADEFTELEGRATEAAANIKDTLTEAVGEFVRMVNESLADLLSSDNINLDQKIEDLKAGFQEAITVLEEGGGSIKRCGYGIACPSAHEVGLSAEDMKNTIVASSNEAGGAVALLDEETRNRLTGNTVTASFDAVAASSKQNLGQVIQDFLAIPPIVNIADAAILGFANDADAGFARAGRRAAETYAQFAQYRQLIPVFEQMAGRIQSIINMGPSLNTTIASANIVNNNRGSTVNVSQTNYNQSTAEQGASNQQLLDQIRGGV